MIITSLRVMKLVWVALDVDSFRRPALRRCLLFRFLSSKIFQQNLTMASDSGLCAPRDGDASKLDMPLQRYKSLKDVENGKYVDHT